MYGDNIEEQALPEKGYGAMQRNIRSPRELLLFKKHHLEEQLKNVNTALLLLEENPKIQEVFEALAKVQGGLL